MNWSYAPNVLIEILKRHHSNAYKCHIIGLEWEISRLFGLEKELEIDHCKLLLSGSRAYCCWDVVNSEDFLVLTNPFYILFREYGSKNFIFDAMNGKSDQSLRALQINIKRPILC